MLCTSYPTVVVEGGEAKQLLARDSANITSVRVGGHGSSDGARRETGQGVRHSVNDI
jgi:hypothetical protein